MIFRAGQVLYRTIKQEVLGRSGQPREEVSVAAARISKTIRPQHTLTGRFGVKTFSHRTMDSGIF
jgi:hypothetical protein